MLITCDEQGIKHYPHQYSCQYLGKTPQCFGYFVNTYPFKQLSPNIHKGAILPNREDFTKFLSEKHL